MSFLKNPRSPLFEFFFSLWSGSRLAKLMLNNRITHPIPIFCAILAISLAILPSSASASTSIVVSVKDQKLALIRDGEKIATYNISTSKFGVGDKPRSYSTPLGKLEVAERVGDGLPIGAVMKARQATGEVLSVNAKGRDPIVTRILHLRGLEPGNANAYERGIYIHGTPVERLIGKPESWGCIRMRSKDVIAVFDAAPLGTPVEIMEEPIKRLIPGMLIATRPEPAPIIAEAPTRKLSEQQIEALAAKAPLAKQPGIQIAAAKTDVAPASKRSDKKHSTASTDPLASVNVTGTSHPSTAPASELPSLGGIANLHDIHSRETAEHRAAGLTLSLW